MDHKTFYFNHSSRTNTIGTSLVVMAFLFFGILTLLSGSEITPLKITIGLLDILVALFFYYAQMTTRYERMWKKRFIRLGAEELDLHPFMFRKGYSLRWTDIQNIEISPDKLRIATLSQRKHQVLLHALHPDSKAELKTSLKIQAELSRIEMTEIQ